MLRCLLISILSAGPLLASNFEIENSTVLTSKGIYRWSQERVAYAVYSPETDQWSTMKITEMPEADHEGKSIIEPNAGCHQRVDLPNGELLRPVRYRKDPKKRVYTSVVGRCRYDGEKLTYLEHGNVFS